MTLRIYMKTPDAVNDALAGPINEALAAEGITVMDEEYESAFERKRREEYAKLEKIGFHYGEACWLTVDTDTGAVSIK